MSTRDYKKENGFSNPLRGCFVDSATKRGKEGNKGCAFAIHSMLYAGSTGRGTKGCAFRISWKCPARTALRRGHLRPKAPPEEVPWPDGIHYNSSVQSKSIVELNKVSRRHFPVGRRTGGVSRNMRKKPSSTDFCGLAAAIKTRRSRTRRRAVKELTTPSRTYSDSSRTCRPNGTIKNRSGCIHIVWLFFIQNKAREHTAPNPYLRVLIAVRGANRKTSRRDFFACFG